MSARRPIVEVRGAEVPRMTQNSADVVVLGFVAVAETITCTRSEAPPSWAAPMHGPSTVRAVCMILILIDKCAVRARSLSVQKIQGVSSGEEKSLFLRLYI